MGLQMEVSAQTMTVQELADFCGCSKQTIDKHVTRKGFINTLTYKNGKQVKAYNLDINQLQDLKNSVAVGKGMLMLPPSDKQSINNEYLEKYIELKGLYEAANAQNKLLEDRQGGLIQENKELNAQLQMKYSEIGSLTAENENLKRIQAGYKRVIAGMGVSLAVIFGLIIVKMLITL